MLEFIRERAQGWIAWIIVGFLILTFSVWGIEYYLSSEAEVNVAKVGDEKITADEFQRAYQQRRMQLQNMLGERFDPSLINDAQLKKDVLERLIERRLLLQMAKDAGLRVTDEQLAQTIRSIPALQQDGRFDQQLYLQLLESQGETVSSFEETVRQDLLLNQLQRGLSLTEFVSKREVSEALRLQQQSRDVGYTVLPVANFMEGPLPTAAEVSQYYEEHRNDYTLPEQVSVEYIELSSDALVQGQPTEEEIRQAYEQRAADFSTPEERRVRHVLIQVPAGADQAKVDAARKRAEEALKRIRAGESFEKVAREISEDPGSASLGGDVGFFGRGVMDPEFEKAAFALNKGQVSDVVRSGFGFHVLKLEDIHAGRSKPLEQVRDEVVRDLQQQKAEERFYERSETLSTRAFENPDSLEPVAKELGLHVQTSEPFSREAGAGIAASPKVRTAAFQEEVLAGANSEPIEIEPGRLIVLRVKEHRPSAARNLEEVRPEIERALVRSKAAERAKAAGEAGLERLRKGEDAAAVASSLGAQWQRKPDVKRADAEVDAGVKKIIFRAPRPTSGKPAFAGEALPNGDYALIAVYKIEEGSVADGSARVAAQESLENEQAMERIREYVEAIKARADIKRYPENI